MAEPDLLIEAGFSDAKLAAEVKKLTDKYREAGKAAEKAFKDSTGSVGDNQAVRAHLRELDKLQRAYDPVYVATKKYEKSVADLDRALKVGAIDQAKYTAEVSRAQVQLGQVSGVATEAVKSTRNFGSMAQNVGYQVQDFAVQVGGGTSATRAFAQQFPQLASAFGPVGVALGTAAAVLVPLGVALLGSGEKALSASESVDALTKSTDAMVSATALASRPIDELRDAFGSLADEIARADQAQAFFTRLRAKADLLGTARAVGSERFGSFIQPTRPQRPAGRPDAPAWSTGPDAQYLRELDRANEATRRQTEALRDMQKQLGASEQQATKLAEAYRRLETATDSRQVAEYSAEIVNLMAAIGNNASLTEGQLKTLSAEAAQVGIVRAQAERQIADAMSEAQKIIDRYAGTTRELRGLSEERAIAEKALARAQSEGNAQLVTDLQEVVRNIDLQISKTKELARESDTAFQGMSRAYQEYGASRMAGNAWAQSAEGFEAQYVAARAAGSGSAEEELVRAVTALSEQMGIAAKDLLAVMSFETGGKLRPDVMGPTTKNGRHFGLIQFGDKGSGPRYGVTPDSSITEQVVAAGRYLQDAGVKAGDSLANVYAAVLSGDARKINASDIAAGGVVGNVSDATSGAQFAPHLARAEGLLRANGSAVQQVATAERTAASERQKALNDEVRERERLAEGVTKYGEQLASNLVTEQQRADLERQRVDAVAAIEAMNLSETDKAAALAEVNGEMQRQLTIMALMADAKRRQVDLDALMVGSSMTYREAINALGDAKKQQIIVDQQVQSETQKAAEAQQFWVDQQRQLEDGLLDAFLAGEAFADVLKNIAAQLAKAALQAALFGRGPMAGGSGGGLLGGLFGFLGGGGATVGNDAMSQALRGARGFEGGGYTGSGGRFDPAGIVHRGEYVMSAPAVQRIGLPTLDAIHRGQTGTGTFAPQTSVVIQGNADDQTITQLRRELDARDLRLRREMPAIMADHQQRAG